MHNMIKASSPIYLNRHWNPVNYLIGSKIALVKRYHLKGLLKEVSARSEILLNFSCNILVDPSVWSFDRKTYTWSSPKSSHSWNPWNPADFTMKSGGFHHEIRRISPWNLADFMKSSGFHEIREIMRISGEIHPNLIKSDVWAKTLLMFQQKLFWFYKVLGGFHLKSAGFHTDFMKSGGFHVKSKDLCKEL